METLLKLVEAIHPISDSLKYHLKQTIKVKQFSKNELLLKAGHVSGHIYFLEKGLLRAYYINKNEEVSSWFMKEGDFVIAVSSFFSQVASTETIQALEDGIVYYLPYKDLQMTYNMFPEFNYIGRVITEKYYALSETITASLRMLRAKERYQYLFTNHYQLIQRVPAKYLCSYLGVTEVTLSRAKFKK